MKIYRVIPMAGISFASRTQAAISLANGHYWLCTGWLQIHSGAFEKYVKFKYPFRVRTDSKRLDCKNLKADGWLVKWKAGKRASLLYTRKQIPKAPARVDNSLNQPPPPAPRLVRDYKVDKPVLAIEMARTGGWLTGSGLRFRPYWLDEDVGVQGFPLVKWEPSGKTGRPEFDPDLNCRTAGDRELERWFTSAKAASYNPYAKKLSGSVGHGFNANEGNSTTVPAPDSDHLTDSGTKFYDWVGHHVT